MSPKKNTSLASLSNVRSPKRQAKGNLSRAAWFQYYAGFSPGFVEDIIQQLELPARATILDPWLGAGTTSEVALASGYRVRGYDLNPAMLLVAKARTLPTSAKAEIPRLLAAVLEGAQAEQSGAEDDPLQQWLSSDTACTFRGIERSIARLAIDGFSQSKPVWQVVGTVPPSSAFFYVGLFRTLRRLIAGFQTSNPTWTKIPGKMERVEIAPQELLGLFETEVGILVKALDGEDRVVPLASPRSCLINRASSTRLPIASGTVDAVVSSPPYCTRIDYVRATLPELAAIGYPGGHRTRSLRHQMIGTPTVGKPSKYDDRAWGQTCRDFLAEVRRHPSKASATYYTKYYHQYFSGVAASLSELYRVTRRGGRCVLVVQDSFYKEIHNNLPLIFSEMATVCGWRLQERFDFHVKSTLACVNPDVKAYRKTFQAMEAAIIFTKG